MDKNAVLSWPCIMRGLAFGQATLGSNASQGEHLLMTFKWLLKFAPGCNIGRSNAAFSDVLQLSRSEVEKVRIGPHAQCCGCGGCAQRMRGYTRSVDYLRTLSTLLSRKQKPE